MTPRWALGLLLAVAAHAQTCLWSSTGSQINCIPAFPPATVQPPGTSIAVIQLSTSSSQFQVFIGRRGKCQLTIIPTSDTYPIELVWIGSTLSVLAGIYTDATTYVPTASHLSVTGDCQAVDLQADGSDPPGITAHVWYGFVNMTQPYAGVYGLALDGRRLVTYSVSPVANTASAPATWLTWW